MSQHLNREQRRALAKKLREQGDVVGAEAALDGRIGMPMRNERLVEICRTLQEESEAANSPAEFAGLTLEDNVDLYSIAELALIEVKTRAAGADPPPERAFSHVVAWGIAVGRMLERDHAKIGVRTLRARRERQGS